MTNIIKRTLSILLAIVMMTVPVFAIVSPEDAAPVLSEREMIKLKSRQLMQTRAQKWNEDLTQQEIADIVAQENIIIAEIEALGADYVTGAELRQNYMRNGESVASPNFEGLITNERTSYIVMGPYSYTYNGNAMYYMEVLVFVNNSQSSLAVAYEGALEPSVQGSTYGSIKNTPFVSYPAGDNYTPNNVLGSAISDTAIVSNYTVDLEFWTAVNYIYIGNQASNYMDDYALGLVSTAIEVKQTHYCNSASDIAYDYIEYYNFGDVDYAFECYYSGSGFEVISPISVSYNFGSEFLGDFNVVQPYTWPYLYD